MSRLLSPSPELSATTKPRDTVIDSVGKKRTEVARKIEDFFTPGNFNLNPELKREQTEEQKQVKYNAIIRDIRRVASTGLDPIAEILRENEYMIIQGQVASVASNGEVFRLAEEIWKMQTEVVRTPQKPTVRSSVFCNRYHRAAGTIEAMIDPRWSPNARKLVEEIKGVLRTSDSQWDACHALMKVFERYQFDRGGALSKDEAALDISMKIWPVFEGRAPKPESKPKRDVVSPVPGQDGVCELNGFTYYVIGKYEGEGEGNGKYIMMERTRPGMKRGDRPHPAVALIPCTSDLDSALADSEYRAVLEARGVRLIENGTQITLPSTQGMTYTLTMRADGSIGGPATAAAAPAAPKPEPAPQPSPPPGRLSSALQSIGSRLKAGWGWLRGTGGKSSGKNPAPANQPIAAERKIAA